MKRYLLFAGDKWYPAGGWNDFKASYDDPAKAIEYLVCENFDWWHVIDATDGSIVAAHYHYST